MKNIFCSILLTVMLLIHENGKATVKDIQILRHGTRLITGVCFLPDGGHLVSTSTDGTIMLWDVKSWKPLWRVNLDKKDSNENYTISSIHSLAVSPDGNKLAIAYDQSQVLNGKLTSNDQSLIGLLSTTNGKLQQIFMLDDPKYSANVVFSPDGKSLVSGGKKIIFWDLTSFQKTNELTMTKFISSIAFSPNGKLLVAGFANPNYDNIHPSFVLFDAEKKQKLREFSLSGCRYVDEVAFSPDGKTLAVLGQTDTQIALWNTSSWCLVQTIKDHGIGSGGLSFSADGNTLVSCDWRGDILLRNMRSVTLNKPYRTGKMLSAICISPDGTKIVVGTDEGEILIIHLSGS